MMKSIFTSVLFVFTMSLSFGQTILVTGSNCVAPFETPVDGTYSSRSTLNGKLRYSDDAYETNLIEWSGSQWIIRFSAGGGGNILYTNNATSSTPPATGWSTGVGFCAGKTAPTISVVLPIELLNFKATPSVSSVKLDWETANEVNNKGFQIERAPQPPKGASEPWDILGFVNAKEKAGRYEFIDKSPLWGLGVYRLRQIDNDGKETLSKVLSASLKSKNVLKAYPSVSTGLLTLETSETGDYQIFNLLGKQVLYGKTMQQIDVSALPQGTYVIKVGLEQAKFVKQ